MSGWATGIFICRTIPFDYIQKSPFLNFLSKTWQNQADSTFPPRPSEKKAPFTLLTSDSALRQRAPNSQEQNQSGENGMREWE